MSSGERAETVSSASPPPRGDVPDRPGARRARGTRSGRPASVRGGGPSGGPSGPTAASSLVGPSPGAGAATGGGIGTWMPSGGGPGPNQSERAASKMGSRTSSEPRPRGPAGGGLAAGGGAAVTDEDETTGARAGGATPPAIAGASRASRSAITTSELGSR